MKNKKKSNQAFKKPSIQQIMDFIKKIEPFLPNTKKVVKVMDNFINKLKKLRKIDKKLPELEHTKTYVKMREEINSLVEIIPDPFKIIKNIDNIEKYIKKIIKKDDKDNLDKIFSKLIHNIENFNKKLKSASIERSIINIEKLIVELSNECPFSDSCKAIRKFQKSAKKLNEVLPAVKLSKALSDFKDFLIKFPNK